MRNLVGDIIRADNCRHEVPFNYGSTTLRAITTSLLWAALLLGGQIKKGGINY